jgi:hypothetical protein
MSVIYLWGGARRRSWLRHYATNRNVVGSISDGVIGIFPWHNRFGRTVALGSTQPLTEMSSRGKGGLCIGLTTVPPSCADCLEIWQPQTPGTMRVCPGMYRDCFTFTSLYISMRLHSTSCEHVRKVVMSNTNYFVLTKVKKSMKKGH